MIISMATSARESSMEKITDIQKDDWKSKYERYVPQGSASLMEDAPGWHGKTNHPKVGNNTLQETTKNSSLNSSSALSNHDIDGGGGVQNDGSGPVCWKCRGTGITKRKKPKQLSSSTNTVTVECSICEGRGHVLPKKKDISGKLKPGVITRIRKCSSGWTPSGPCPYVLRNHHQQQYASSSGDPKWIDFLLRANRREHVEVMNDHGTSPSVDTDIPSWIPRPGEELCNLVGSWRILQRVGSHRWTTDDLCTAYVAAREAENISRNHPHGLRSYLDLGCGNASVLQMVTWALLRKQQPEQQQEQQSKLQEQQSEEQPNHAFLKHCIGIEARSEAVELARRSISFNVGNPKEQEEHGRKPKKTGVHIVHGDFRDVVQSSLSSSTTTTESEFSHIVGNKPPKFDLITGTPPYFRVDFDVGNSNNNNNNNNNNAQVGATDATTRVVQNAIIRQGGMPTAMQSAPARCEFRGGIEAYCYAAASVLQPVTGRFIVCENWLNHARVLKGGQDAHLDLLKMVRVEGKKGRGTLFCVYVFAKEKKDHKRTEQLPSSLQNATTTTTTAKQATVEEITISVRSVDGEWTKQYKDTVLEYMSIPTPPTMVPKEKD